MLFLADSYFIIVDIIPGFFKQKRTFSFLFESIFLHQKFPPLRHIFIVIFIFLASTITGFSQQHKLFIGTYTGTGSKGIYVYSFDARTGKMMFLSSTDSADNPSFLALSPNGKQLYAVNEIASPTGGKLSQYDINKSTGQLTFVNAEATGGDHPCYVAIDPSGKWASVANYTGGSFASFALDENGQIEERAQLVQHTGKGYDAERQAAPHVHSTLFVDKGKVLLVADLGLDTIFAHRFSAGEKLPISADAYGIPMPAGSGPRHMMWSQKHKLLYVIDEMKGAITVFKKKRNRWKKKRRVEAHTAENVGPFGSADLHMSPDGRFLYASNRGTENNIAILKVKKCGKLKTVGYQSTLGEQPRNFCIDPSGQFLLAANQKTNNVVIFKRNLRTGLLTALPDQLQIPTPVCLVMQEN